MASKMKNRDRVKTDYDRVEAKGGKMNAGLKAFLAKKKKKRVKK